MDRQSENELDATRAAKEKLLQERNFRQTFAQWWNEAAVKSLESKQKTERRKTEAA